MTTYIITELILKGMPETEQIQLRRECNNQLELDLSLENLTVLPDLSLYTNLQILHCSFNQLTSLDNLPLTLQELVCDHNQITSLNHLPPNLQGLWCYNNQLTHLKHLPSNLQTLICYNNQLKHLKHLPSTLQILNCSFNQLTRLGVILPELCCYQNPIYTTCNELYGFELSEKTIEQYNEIKRIENAEKECCPLLK